MILKSTLNIFQKSQIAIATCIHPDFDTCIFPPGHRTRITQVASKRNMQGFYNALYMGIIR